MVRILLVIFPSFSHHDASINPFSHRSLGAEAYMVPQVRVVAALPLSASGKVDRRALLEEESNFGRGHETWTEKPENGFPLEFLQF